jgi:hypothetical protein
MTLAIEVLKALLDLIVNDFAFKAASTSHGKLDGRENDCLTSLPGEASIDRVLLLPLLTGDGDLSLEQLLEDLVFEL